MASNSDTSLQYIVDIEAILGKVEFDNPAKAMQKKIQQVFDSIGALDAGVSLRLNIENDKRSIDQLMQDFKVQLKKAAKQLSIEGGLSLRLAERLKEEFEAGRVSLDKEGTITKNRLRKTLKGIMSELEIMMDLGKMGFGTKHQQDLIKSHYDLLGQTAEQAIGGLSKKLEKGAEVLKFGDQIKQYIKDADEDSGRLLKMMQGHSFKFKKLSEEGAALASDIFLNEGKSIAQFSDTVVQEVAEFGTAMSQFAAISKKLLQGQTNLELFAGEDGSKVRTQFSGLLNTVNDLAASGQKLQRFTSVVSTMSAGAGEVRSLAAAFEQTESAIKTLGSLSPDIGIEGLLKIKQETQGIISSNTKLLESYKGMKNISAETAEQVSRIALSTKSLEEGVARVDVTLKGVKATEADIASLRSKEVGLVREVEASLLKLSKVEYKQPIDSKATKENLSILKETEKSLQSGVTLLAKQESNAETISILHKQITGETKDYSKELQGVVAKRKELEGSLSSQRVQIEQVTAELAKQGNSTAELAAFEKRREASQRSVNAHLQEQSKILKEINAQEGGFNNEKNITGLLKYQEALASTRSTLKSYLTLLLSAPTDAFDQGQVDSIRKQLEALKQVQTITDEWISNLKQLRAEHEKFGREAVIALDKAEQAVKSLSSIRPDIGIEGLLKIKQETQGIISSNTKLLDSYKGMKNVSAETAEQVSKIAAFTKTLEEGVARVDVTLKGVKATEGDIATLRSKEVARVREIEAALLKLSQIEYKQPVDNEATKENLTLLKETEKVLQSSLAILDKQEKDTQSLAILYNQVTGEVKDYSRELSGIVAKREEISGLLDTQRTRIKEVTDELRKQGGEEKNTEIFIRRKEALQRAVNVTLKEQAKIQKDISSSGGLNVEQSIPKLKKYQEALVAAKTALKTLLTQLASAPKDLFDQKQIDLAQRQLETIVKKQAATGKLVTQLEKLKTAQQAVNEASALASRTDLTNESRVRALGQEITARERLVKLLQAYKFPDYQRAAKDQLAFISRLQQQRESLKGTQEELSRTATFMGNLQTAFRSFLRYAVEYRLFYEVASGARSLATEVINLSDSLVSIQAIARATAGEMQLVEAAIKNVSTTTEFTTADIAEAAKVLAQAGVEVSDIASNLSAVAQFASATQAGLDTAADLFSTMKNLFSELDVKQIADQLTSVVNISKITPKGLSTIISRAGQIAKDYQIASEQMLAAFATLRNVGIKDSTIATGLRQGILELLSPDEKTLDVLERRYAALGQNLSRESISAMFQGFREAENPLLAVINELEKLGATTVAAADFNRVFDVRAQNVITALIDQKQAFIQAEAQINNYGAAAQGAEKQMDSLSNSVDNLGAVITVAASNIAGGMVSTLEGVVDAAADAVEGLDNTTTSVQKLTGSSGVAVSALAGLLAGIAKYTAGGSFLGSVGAGVGIAGILQVVNSYIVSFAGRFGEGVASTVQTILDAVIVFLFSKSLLSSKAVVPAVTTAMTAAMAKSSSSTAAVAATVGAKAGGLISSLTTTVLGFIRGNWVGLLVALGVVLTEVFTRSSDTKIKAAQIATDKLRAEIQTLADKEGQLKADQDALASLKRASKQADEALQSLYGRFTTEPAKTLEKIAAGVSSETVSDRAAEVEKAFDKLVKGSKSLTSTVFQNNLEAYAKALGVAVEKIDPSAVITAANEALAAIDSANGVRINTWQRIINTLNKENRTQQEEELLKQYEALTNEEKTLLRNRVDSTKDRRDFVDVFNKLLIQGGDLFKEEKARLEEQLGKSLQDEVRLSIDKALESGDYGELQAKIEEAVKDGNVKLVEIYREQIGRVNQEIEEGIGGVSFSEIKGTVKAGFTLLVKGINELFLPEKIVELLGGAVSGGKPIASDILAGAETAAIDNAIDKVAVSFDAMSTKVAESTDKLRGALSDTELDRVGLSVTSLANSLTSAQTLAEGVPERFRALTEAALRGQLASTDFSDRVESARDAAGKLPDSLQKVLDAVLAQEREQAKTEGLLKTLNQEIAARQKKGEDIQAELDKIRQSSSVNAEQVQRVADLSTEQQTLVAEQNTALARRTVLLDRLVKSHQSLAEIAEDAERGEKSIATRNIEAAARVAALQDEKAKLLEQGRPDLVLSQNLQKEINTRTEQHQRELVEARRQTLTDMVATSKELGKLGNSYQEISNFFSTGEGSRFKSKHPEVADALQKYLEAVDGLRDVTEAAALETKNLQIAEVGKKLEAIASSLELARLQYDRMLRAGEDTSSIENKISGLLNERSKLQDQQNKLNGLTTEELEKQRKIIAEQNRLEELKLKSDTIKQKQSEIASILEVQRAIYDDAVKNGQDTLGIELAIADTLRQQYDLSKQQLETEGLSQKEIERQLLLKRAANDKLAESLRQQSVGGVGDPNSPNYDQAAYIHAQDQFQELSRRGQFEREQGIDTSTALGRQAYDAFLRTIQDDSTENRKIYEAYVKAYFNPVGGGQAEAGLLKDSTSFAPGKLPDGVKRRGSAFSDIEANLEGLADGIPDAVKTALASIEGLSPEQQATVQQSIADKTKEVTSGVEPVFPEESSREMAQALASDAALAFTNSDISFVDEQTKSMSDAIADKAAEELKKADTGLSEDQLVRISEEISRVIGQALSSIEGITFSEDQMSLIANELAGKLTEAMKTSELTLPEDFLTSVAEAVSTAVTDALKELSIVFPEDSAAQIGETLSDTISKALETLEISLSEDSTADLVSALMTLLKSAVDAIEVVIPEENLTELTGILQELVKSFFNSITLSPEEQNQEVLIQALNTKIEEYVAGLTFNVSPEQLDSVQQALAKRVQDYISQLELTPGEADTQAISVVLVDLVSKFLGAISAQPSAEVTTEIQNKVGELVVSAFEGVSVQLDVGNQVRDIVVAPFQRAAEEAAAAISSGGVTIQRSLTGLAQTVYSFASRMAEALGSPQPAPIQTRKDGGHITGPGTGTSDSIMARLSNGEYVITADKVRQFGKGFFDRILSGDLLPGFARGGAISHGTPNATLYPQTAPAPDAVERQIQKIKANILPAVEACPAAPSSLEQTLRKLVASGGYTGDLYSFNNPTSGYTPKFASGGPVRVTHGRPSYASFPAPEKAARDPVTIVARELQEVQSPLCSPVEKALGDFFQEFKPEIAPTYSAKFLRGLAGFRDGGIVGSLPSLSGVVNNVVNNNSQLAAGPTGAPVTINIPGLPAFEATAPVDTIRKYQQYSDIQRIKRGRK